MVDVSVEDLTKTTGPMAGSSVTARSGRPITESDAEDWIIRNCFTDGPPGRVGIELEFVVHRGTDPPEHLTPGELNRLHGDIRALPLRSGFSVEPGGQIEISSPPAEHFSVAINDVADDLRLLTEIVGRNGARLVGTGVDPLPLPRRLLRLPRYDAMEAYFDRTGAVGRVMMRSSASVQVNLEAVRTGAAAGERERRWDLLHLVGPVAAAAFGRPSAHPVTDPRLAAYRLLRQGIWLTLDPARCRAPARSSGETLQETYARWVLDAPLLAVRRADRPWTAPAGATFRNWLRHGIRVVPDRPPPTLEDLELQLSTMFPPVRARGHLEVRFLDAQPGPWWRVPAAVIAALVDDATAADAAADICEPFASAWESSARNGLEDRSLRSAARRLLAVGAGALDRAQQPGLARAADEYLDRVALVRSGPSSPDKEIPC